MGNNQYNGPERRDSFFHPDCGANHGKMVAQVANLEKKVNLQCQIFTARNDQINESFKEIEKMITEKLSHGIKRATFQWGMATLSTVGIAAIGLILTYMYHEFSTFRQDYATSNERVITQMVSIEKRLSDNFIDLANKKDASTNRLNEKIDSLKDRTARIETAVENLYNQYKELNK